MHSSSSKIPYCPSRIATQRRVSRVTMVGPVGVGGDNPIRIQSMTTSDTQDVSATVAQCIELAEHGCEIVRITAPNVPAAACLREIRRRFSEAGFSGVPLVADIHFLPQAAMEAVEHVEKIRINPGNYADKKKFAATEYSDAEYKRELERLHEAVSPLILRCKQLGRSLRIGTNHGSLSDRIMNRYGDSPLGMVESALEFVRICEDHGFHDIVLSMKASNPKVVIQAYRLLVSRMDAGFGAYPLHLGVTEAGDGEDGRIKSAIGIGSLLLDGIGDTIRVSLTEDSIHELPVARALADRVMAEWRKVSPSTPEPAVPERFDPFKYQRRNCSLVSLGTTGVGASKVPGVVTFLRQDSQTSSLPGQLASLHAPSLKDTPAEGIGLRIQSADQLRVLPSTAPAALVLDLDPGLSVDALASAPALPSGSILARRFLASEGPLLSAFLRFTREQGLVLAIGLDDADAASLAEVLKSLGSEGTIVFCPPARPAIGHQLGAYRALAARLESLNFAAPLWIRASAPRHAGEKPASDLDILLETSLLAGSLLCDGLGDLLSVEDEPDPLKSLRLAYNVLQGAGARISKTEYVACPSCGRTLFDLQSTTQRIRAITGHLKGVKIAIMGCIVNGPGEMADADFGYVGGAPGKINLYVGKHCVQFNIPQAEADLRLVSLIKEQGKWTEPDANVANS
jgi:(E)-4-hydroxy-3-methylbut-2-enyl-diphosphate synthase